MVKKIAFVINPNAGVKKKLDIIHFIKKNSSQIHDSEFIIWHDKYDFESVKQKIKSGGYDIVVACGGDGTVNQVASVIAHSEMALGILPLGSGNGLARSNGIPMDLIKALKVIERGSYKQIDGAKINDSPFFCTAGIGFDAHIAHEFAMSTKRGFATYFNKTVKSFFAYKPNYYTICIDGKKIETKAFLVTVANSGQWGNDVYIAPKAQLNDGWLNISILKPFSTSSLPLIGIKLFLKKIDTSSKVISDKGKKIEIEFDGELPVHFDGEPMLVKSKLIVHIMPLALRIVC